MEFKSAGCHTLLIMNMHKIDIGSYENMNLSIWIFTHHNMISVYVITWLHFGQLIGQVIVDNRLTSILDSFNIGQGFCPENMNE